MHTHTHTHTYTHSYDYILILKPFLMCNIFTVFNDQQFGVIS